MFQLTAARRRLVSGQYRQKDRDRVSTHSRPKAAGTPAVCGVGGAKFQLRAARRRLVRVNSIRPFHALRFNSQPPEGGWVKWETTILLIWTFQLTAARRRLGPGERSTVSRNRFNSQPPEGGWLWELVQVRPILSFNSQPPEGGWP